MNTDTELLERMEKDLRRGHLDVYRVCLTTIYSCGLRLLEGATVEVPQIDSDRMQLHIHGKGGRDRFVPLAEDTLLMLREFWKTHRSPMLLFPAPTRKGLKHSLATDVVGFGNPRDSGDRKRIGVTG